MGAIWDGGYQVELERKDIHKSCKWGHGDHSANKIAVVNMAFRLFYQGRRVILKTKSKKIKKRLAEMLEDAATSGYNDMQDACDHLDERMNDDPWWTDTATKYASIPGWVTHDGRFQVPGVHASLPDGPVNFLKAVEEQVADLKKPSVEKYLPPVDELIKAWEKGAYEGAVESIKKVKSVADTIEPWMWIAPDKVNAALEEGKKWLSYASLVTDFVDCIDEVDKYRSAGFNDKTSVAFVALKKAVGFVPVFGQFYEEALESCPSFLGDFKEAVETRQERILNISRSN